VHVIADAASGSAWSFGSSILTFAFPMILFIVVAGALYVAYTKPELVPGRRVPSSVHPMTYTNVPGESAATTAGDKKAPEGPRGAVPPGKHEPEGGA
jgi:hypothetical protein